MEENDSVWIIWSLRCICNNQTDFHLAIAYIGLEFDRGLAGGSHLGVITI